MNFIKLNVTKFKVIFVASLLLILSGCTLFGQNSNIDSDDWENEILMAQECGLEQLPCCRDQEPICEHGLNCCVDPGNKHNTFCAADCACGIEGNFCCVGEARCEEGLACVGSRCLECGNMNQPCCLSEEQCSGNLLCHHGECLRCGVAGNPCCPNETACLDQDRQDRRRTECQNKICVYCGSRNGIACVAEPACADGHLLNNGFCLPCGGANQPCCDELSGAGYDCETKLDLVCELGFCTRK